VLMQEGQPIAFFSPALKGRALLLSTYEKELLALVTYVQKWQPYLLGQSFIVHTDKQSLKFLLEQKVGTNSQHRWASKLLGYDFAFEYKKGKDNRVATERFRLKVTEVEESKYLDIVKVEELVVLFKPMNFPCLNPKERTWL
jgi:hypothetical protein